MGIGQDNKRLDVYRVEQRLKYLGFPALDAAGAYKDFAVDGNFKPEEAGGLEWFEKVVRYQSVTATGSGTSGGVTAEIQYRATVVAGSENVKLEEVVGSYKLTTLPANATAVAKAAAKTAATADAKTKALKAAGFSSESDKNGMDGVIEKAVSGTAPNAISAQGKTTLDWLNAYNAPHWMQFFATTATGYATTNEKLGADEWSNLQTGGTKTNVFGTSWVFDLMKAATSAMTRYTGAEALRFNGAGDLGTALNLGISPQYIAQANQDRVAGKDVVIGLTKPAANSTVPTGVTGVGVAAYTQNQWNYNNAVTLSGLLTNVNPPASASPPSTACCRAHRLRW